MITSTIEILTAIGKRDVATAAQIAIIDMLIPQVESAVQQFLGYRLEYQQHTELLPPLTTAVGSDPILTDFEKSASGLVIPISPRASEGLLLSHQPVWLSGLQVWEDVDAPRRGANAFSENTLLTHGTDYWLDVCHPAVGMSQSGVLVRNNYWSREGRTIKVVYNAGFTGQQLDGTDAAAVKKAIIDAVAANFYAEEERRKPTKRSESIGKYSYSIGNAPGDALAGWSTMIPNSTREILQPYRSYRLF